MHLYRLNRDPSASAGEGENWDEWFRGLVGARKRRREIIEEVGDDPNFYVYGAHLSIDKITLADLPRLSLALAVLNGTGYISAIEQMESAYEPKAKN